MLCERCKINDATVRYTKNINGIKIQQNICKDCLEKLEYKKDFIDDFFNDFFYSYILSDINKKDIECKVCGNTFESFRNNGKIGCENCYYTFKNKLDTILNNIQHKNIHIGKIPNNIEKFKPNLDTIPELKKLLDIAVKNENYEDAIILRDKIKSMERGDI